MAEKIGPIARPARVFFTARPAEDALGQDHAAAAARHRRGRVLGDVTTLANAEIVEQIHGMMETATGEE
ncbi:MAG: hypothetical protein KatS3mg013_1745 [Actinomycetota bacterium]|nr:MAG: hypothetical protein KatS3mg013_1745 [Actinomycetota bacterium]